MPIKKKLIKQTKLTKNFILPNDIDPELWAIWMIIRQRKKAINSDIALKALITRLKEIENAGKYTKNQAIKIAIQESWKSVRLHWLTNLEENDNAENSKTRRKTGAELIADDIIKSKLLR